LAWLSVSVSNGTAIACAQGGGVWVSTTPENSNSWNTLTSSSGQFIDSLAWSSVSVSNGTAIACARGGGVWLINLLPICFLSDCDIVLEDYSTKNISVLEKSDKVLGYFSKQPQSISQILKTKHQIKSLQPTNVPYLIKKSSFSENVPEKDIHLSGHHRIILKTGENNFTGIQTFKLQECVKVNYNNLEEKVEYYHIILENKEESLIANNLPVESCVDF
jgi:hypothetical protein